MKRIHRALGLIALGWLIGSCGDGPTEPPTPTTATVVMSAATASLVPAASIQLSAVAKSQSGQALSRVFTWTSSDPGKATVSSSGMVVGVAPGTATVAAGVDGKSASTTVTVLDGGVVSNTGATLQVGSGVVQLTVPPGAVSSATNVSVVPSTAFANEPRVVKGTPFDFGPTGTTFAKPVSLTLKYDPAVLPAGIEERALRIYLLEGATWQPLETSTVDLSTKTVTAQVAHFSTYAILTPVPVSSVTVTVSPATVFVGQTSQAAAILKDLGGNVLDGRTVAWSSSNAGVATVDPISGVVTAVAAGTATITASSEGMSGTSSVTVTLVPVGSVTVALAASSISAIETTQATATTLDGSGGVLTERSVTWSSDNAAIATVSPAGLVSAVSAGVVSITAASEGKNGSATLTVTPAPVTAASVSPASATVTAGMTEQLTVTLRDAHNNVLSGRAVTWTSSAPSIATVSESGLVSAVTQGNATITATSEGQSASSSITVTPVPVGTVTVSPPSVTVVAGFTEQLTAEARDASDNLLTDRAVAWSSSDPAVATVSLTGVVTAVAPGTATITATSDGKSGTSSITVTPVPVASVTVALAASSINAGETTQATAATLEGSGGVLTGHAITWTSSNTAVATVSSSGLVTAVSAGTANIIATSEGKSGSAPVTVTLAPVASVSVSPPTVSIVAGTTQQLGVEIRDAGNSVLTGRLVTWTSSNQEVATVSPAGLVTGVAAGAATITATSEGEGGTSLITVTPVPVASVTVALTPSSINAVETTQASATTLASSGTTLTGRAITWSSDDETVATVSNSGLVTAVSAGTANIIATSEGKIGNATLTVSPAPVASVSVTLALSSLAAIETTQASVTLKDSKDRVLTGRTIVWSSDNTGVASVSSSGLVTAVSAGTTNITATSEGRTGGAPISVTPSPVASVSVSAAIATIVAGSTQQLFAETRDAANNVLTGRLVTWASSNEGVAIVSTSGLVTALAPGTATITAASEGHSGTSSITVTPVPVVSVTVALASSSITAIETTQASAIMFGAGGVVLTGRIVTWSSDNTAVATVSPSGLVTALSVGTANIVAASEGKTAGAALAVTPAPVATISVSPSAASIVAGSTRQLSSETRDAHNTVLTGRSVTWSSSNESVATVNASGLVTGVVSGSATVTATSEGQSATAAITVTPAPVASLTVALAVNSINAVETTQATATTLDDNGRVLTGRTVAWSSDNTAVATVSSGGLVTAIKAGTANIIATSEGQTGSAALTVTAAPVATVMVSPPAPSIVAGNVEPLTATLKDAQNRELTDRTVTWQSSNEAIATVSSSGVVTGAAPGTATITATSEGKSAISSITVTPAPVASVTVGLAASSINAVETTQATATTLGVSGGVLTGRAVTWSSSNEAVAIVSATGLVSAVGVGTANIIATSEGQSGSSTLTVTQAPVATVTVALAASPINAVQTTQATATLKDSENRVLTGRSITWSSDNEGVATISSTGLVTAVAAGSATITSTSEGKTGSALLTVTPAPVASITVSPPAPTIVAGSSQQLTAEMRDVANNVLTGRAVTWSSSDANVATVSVSGLVTGVAQGTATITATSEGQSGTSSITVTPAPVAAVSVSLAASSINAVETTQASAVTRDAGGAVLTGRAIAWSSDNESVATVSSTGLVTAVAVGTANIIATSEGQSGSSALTVTQAPVATVSVTLAASSINAVQTTQATATLKDAQDRVLTGRTIVWTSDNTTMATVSSSGLVTAVSVGTANITATSESQSGSVTLTVTPAPVATVTVNPTSTTITAGSTEQLTATPTDSQNRVLTGRSVTWTSNQTGVATVSSAGLVTGVAPGSATITGASEGQSATASITVIPVPVASVTVALASTSITAIETTQATATVLDVGGGVLTGRDITWTSSNTAVATVSNAGLVTAAGIGTANVTAASEGKSGSATLTVTSAPVASITITLAASSITGGETTQGTATTRDANGALLTGRVITWSSDNSAVASVSSSGLITGVAPGSANITATSEGRSATAAVSVTPIPVAAVSVALLPSSISAVETAQATATTLDARGGVLPGRSVTWSSDNTAVATVSTITGLVTAVATGTAHITATSEGKSGNATITVTPAPVATVLVTLAASSINAVQTTQATVLLHDAKGGVLSGRSVNWSSDNTGVATVSSAGIVTAVSEGTANITATSEGKAGSAPISVTPAPVASVTVSPTGASIVAGNTEQLTAALKDAQNRVLAGRTVTWESDNTAVATVSNTGLVTALSAGGTTITASSEGTTGSATVTVTPIPVASVSVQLSATSVVPGESATVSATTRDASGNILTGRSVAWSSDNLAVASVSISGLVTAIGPGSAVISATSEGQTGSATLTVTPIPVASVTVSPSTASVVAGASQQLSAETRDAGNNVLTGRVVTWSSSDMGVATVSATGLVSSVAAGTATITAQSEGKSGAAIVTVTPAPVGSVTVSLAVVSIQVAQTTQATATTLDSNGNIVTGRSITWSSDTQSVATVSASGVVAAVAPGTATITATSEGKSGSATITVVPIPVAAVTVALVPSTITAVETAQATATTRGADGGELTGRIITWSSDNTSVATVSSTGVVTAVSAGTTQISATSEGRTGNAMLTVTQAPVASVTIGLASSTITAIGTTQASATLLDANGGTLSGRVITWTSADPSVASVSSIGFVTAVSAGTVNITATSEGKSGSALLTVTPAPVATVSVSPPAASIVAGSTQQLSAETRDANNNVLAGRAVTWSSSDAGVATISTTGLVTAVAPGTATITATSEGQSGASSITVTPVPVDAVTVTLAASSINAVEVTQATATLLDGSGGVLTGRPIAWSSDNTAIATVSSSGLVTAVSAGTVNIIATSEGRSGSASLTVTPAPVASVVVDPVSATVTVGSTEELSVTLRDAHNNMLTGRVVSWTSSATAIATVSSTGVVTAVAVGGATITATSEGQSASSTVTVTPVPVATVSVSLALSSIHAGQTTQATATLFDADGGVLTGRTVVWSSNNTSVATVSSAGLVTAVAPGSATISATSDGKSGSATVTVTPVPVATVTVNPATASVVAGASQQLAAETRDASNNVLTGRAVTWTSDAVSVATVSATGLVTAVSPGTATITATIEGKTGTSAITVTPVPVASVTVTLAASSINAVETTQATATTLGGSGGVLTGRGVTWSSDNTAVATVSSSGLVTAVTAGTANITATSEGKSGSAILTVTPAPVASVNVTLAATSITAIGTTQATATLKDAQDRVLTGRSIVWSSDNTAVATVSSSGLVTAIGAGTTNITATSEARSGSAALTVTPAPVASVTVTPLTATVVAGSTQQMTAEMRDASNNVLTGRLVTWTSSNEGVATVSPTGLLSAVAPGTTTITAASESQAGASSITVSPTPVASVSVALAASSIDAVGTTQATATTLDGSGGVLTGRVVTWSSNNEAVATVSSSGLVTAVSVGTANITATSEGKTGSATLTVTPAPVATVSVSLAATSITAVGTTQASATLKDAQDRVLTGRSVVWSSDNTAAATVSSSGLVTAVGAGTANIIATSESKIGSALLTVTPASVASVTVSPATATIVAGSTRQLAAETRDAASNVLAGRLVTWVSSDDGVATVSAAGLVTGVTPGTATITATSEGQSGASAMTVSPTPVASVGVTLAANSINAIETTQATATTRDAGGNVLTGRGLTWSSDNTSVATVSTSGLVTAVSPGSATISATSEGITGSASLTVTPAPVATVTVSPATASVVAGSTQQLAAETRDANNTVLIGRSVSWSSSNESVARVNASGLVTGVAAGPATITATSEGQSGASSITVTPAPVASVSVALTPGTITAVETAQATATLLDAGGGVLTGRSVAWSSDNESVAIVSGTGLITAVAPGSAGIIGTSEGQTGSAALIVTPAPVATVTVSPAAPSIVAGNAEQLTATLTDAQSRVLVGRTVTWQSDNEAVATVSSSGLVTGVGPGTAAISATSEGQTGTSSITVTPAPVASVSVSLAASSINAVEATQASAVTRDASGAVLTGRAIAWSSDNESVATVSSTGLVTAVAVGTANISAASEGQSGSGVLTVTPAPVNTVTVSLVASSINAVQATQATATLKDAKDRVLTGRTIAWSSDNTTVATVSSSGLVTAVSAGTANITATSESQSAGAALTVTPAPVATVTVSPPAPSIIAGNTEQLSVTLKDAQDRVLSDRTVTWASDNTGVATVSSTGVVTAVSGGTATITATSEGVTGTSLVTVTDPLSTVSLLHRSTQNPRYFENASGQIVYLTGSHTWSNLQDNGTTDPPAAFNYTAYLDFLESHNHNFFRLWAWEQAKWTAEITADYWITPGPFLRTGPATALDGKPRFDLTQFNQAYFDRLRQRVIDAGARGIYVSVMLFDGWSVATKEGFADNNPWKGHPFNAANNINGINGDTNGDGLGLENQTLGNSAVTALQDAYVRKVIDAVGDLDNVLYEISNESDASSRDWQYHMIQVIRDYESTRPKQHPVGMTAMWPGGSDADLTSSAADWISASGTVAGSLNLPATATGAKVLITDTDHLCGICGDMAWVWKSFAKGHNPILMDGYDDAAIGMGAADYNPSDPKWEAIRKNMGYTLGYARRMDLANALPHGDLVLSELVGYALAKPGSQYLVFVPGGGSVTLDLSAVSGSLNVEWFNPATGVATSAGTVAGGPSRILTSPFGGAAVLFLH